MTAQRSRLRCGAASTRPLQKAQGAGHPKITFHLARSGPPASILALQWSSYDLLEYLARPSVSFPELHRVSFYGLTSNAVPQPPWHPEPVPPNCVVPTTPPLPLRTSFAEGEAPSGLPVNVCSTLKDQVPSFWEGGFSLNTFPCADLFVATAVVP